MAGGDDFGHSGISLGSGTHIDSWGRGPFVIEADGHSYRFEDSDQFGPALLKKNDELKANPWPGERSPFWRAHFAWSKQGRRTEADGVTCIYDPVNPTLYRMVGGVAFVVEAGDDNGGYEEIK